MVPLNCKLHVLGLLRVFFILTANRPTMQLLLDFPGMKRRINIAKDISTHYREVGTFLLEEETNATVNSLSHSCNRDCEEINSRLLNRWLEGKGKKPITWETLVEVLRKAELQVLADEIKEGCRHKIYTKK